MQGGDRSGRRLSLALEIRLLGKNVLTRSAGALVA